jgi:alpha-mannosidase
MTSSLDKPLQGWIETFAPLRELDLMPLLQGPDGSPALNNPWGANHRPDWHQRGLLIWPRGGQRLLLNYKLRCPTSWLGEQPGAARLALRWWADQAELRVNGRTVQRGDLFDANCRWLLPPSFWQGQPLELELELRSPLHDDGALLLARLEREPLEASDSQGLLLLPQLRRLGELLPQLERSKATPALERLGAALQGQPGDAGALQQLRGALGQLAKPGELSVVSHAHLDLAWLWPVADTWSAAERTFESVLALMAEYPELRFGHSTPALYHWLELHRPQLFQAILAASREGRWEPLNGPWVETDCTLVGSASLLRQFLEGQAYSRQHFPDWSHELAWLPDSFGFSSGLPAVCAASGVRWFITHKLFWNATNPFPHRLFCWRHASGAETLALMSAPIGSDADPLAMARYSNDWQRATGVEQGLWLPGVGDHGGGPSREMLDQLQLWQQQPLSAPRSFDSVRGYLTRLEPLVAGLPVWRDELYLELHRGCPTSRPDQKRHNRSLERLLLAADLIEALSAAAPSGQQQWRSLMFNQFHDILPGTSIPEVFEQAEPLWRQARRQTCRRRDAAIARLVPLAEGAQKQWWIGQLLPARAGLRLLRLPLPAPGMHWCGSAGPLPLQRASAGGCWLGLELGGGVELQRIGQRPDHETAVAVIPSNPVELNQLGKDCWSTSNGLVQAELGPAGVEQLRGEASRDLLAAPLALNRYGDRGRFWDAWDLAADYPKHPLPFAWQEGPLLLERGPLCSQWRWRGHCGASPIQMLVRLMADSPWLELVISSDWRQCHELLRCELPLAQVGSFWTADCPGGVQDRATKPCTAREQSRWEAAAVSWLAGGSAEAGLAVLLDGPQGVNGDAKGLGISLLRGPTWPDPSADQGYQRLRLGLMPAAGGWWQAGVAAAAAAFRQPLWCHPAANGGLERRQLLSWPDPHLQLLAIGGADPLHLYAQNLSPCRRDWPRAWTPWELGQFELGMPATAPMDQSS